MNRGISAWMMAIRPKTLPAGASPVILATALALIYGVFHPVIALCALVCAVLMQITSNLVNDLYDFRKGADSLERLGPPRAVASGVLSERAVRAGAWMAGCMAFVLGQYLVWKGGWMILLIGVLSLFTAWAYTGGPYPLSYRGFGELLAFVFFGIVPVCGTYYLQSQQWNMDVFIFSCIPGLYAASILLVNNIRDIYTDSSVGKRTLVVMIGERAAKILYILFITLALVLSIVWISWYQSLWFCLVVLHLPFTLRAAYGVLHEQGRGLNRVLIQTVQLLLFNTILLVIALLLRYQFPV